MTQKISQMNGTLTLIGSGEMAPSMGKVHRAVLSRVSGSVKAVFLDTPAGFELNVDQISAKAVAYFKQRLQINLDVASFRTALTATPVEVESVVEQLRTANYILAGPGSPTYAIRNWRDTAVWDAVVQRVTDGAHFVSASAAAIALGRFALPVYEIYKVGEAPHWVEGLDLLGPYGLELVVVPHWNNADGGTHDTRYCYMGEPRFRALEQLLPETTVVFGIDEYTACILDLASGSGQVIGSGRVTVRRASYETIFPSGAVFKLDQLKDVDLCAEQGTVFVTDALTQPVQTPFERNEFSGDVGPSNAAEDPLATDIPFIELLISVRAKLRAEEHWAMADEIRQRLSELGVTLEDGPAQTTWRRD